MAKRTGQQAVRGTLYAIAPKNRLIGLRAGKEKHMKTKQEKPPCLSVADARLRQVASVCSLRCHDESFQCPARERTVHYKDSSSDLSGLEKNLQTSESCLEKIH
jgi:hypothetical protein